MTPSLLLVLLLAGGVAGAAAQGVGVEPTIHRIEVGGHQVTEFAVPFAVGGSLGRLRLDAGGAWARAVLDRPDQRSRIEGMTDVVVRGTLSLLGERARVLVAASVPAGSRESRGEPAGIAAALATDLFLLPVNSFGSGSSLTAGLALVQPVGRFTAGAGAAYRRGAAFEPLPGGAGGVPSEFRRGDELRVRGSLETRRVGRVRVRLAGTWLHFGEDRTAGAASLRLGDSFVGEGQVDVTIRTAAARVYGWHLYRSAGQAFDDSPAGLQAAARRNLAGAGARVALSFRRVMLEPVGEVIVQRGTAADEDARAVRGHLLRGGLGATLRWRTLSLEPAALIQRGELDGERLRGFIVRGGVRWIR